MNNLIEAKQAVKNHGVKGFRKLKLKREIYTIGKQGAYINSHIAARMIGRLEEIGFVIQDKKCIESLIGHGLLDTLSIYPA